MSTLSIFEDHTLFVQVAREIAMDVHELPKILEIYGITQERWEKIQNNKAFQELLSSEIATWQGSLNTSERVKLKCGAAIEAWLEELYKRIHDPREALNSKIEGGKLLAKLAGYGVSDANIRDETQRFQLQIVINPSSKVEINTMKTINHED
jgi:hypothetical protein